jgi:hypothetical protein
MSVKLWKLTQAARASLDCIERVSIRFDDKRMAFTLTEVNSPPMIGARGGKVDEKSMMDINASG